MDDNTTPEDMNEHDPNHDDTQDERLDDTTEQLPVVDDLTDVFADDTDTEDTDDADVDGVDEAPSHELVEAQVDEADEADVADDMVAPVFAEQVTDVTAGDELLAEAAALEDPADTVDAPQDAAEPAAHGAYVWAQDEIRGDAPAGEPAAAIPPPQPQPHPVETDRLVRDPNATLGGVASGIAHRFGFEVALTRLAFILLILFSGGTAIIGYILAWIVIPRATYWPPTPRTRTSRFSTRELGIGLVGLGALVGLAIGGGAAGSVLVPLALVGGGVWLLTQEPRLVPAAAAMAPAGGVMAPPPPAAPAAGGGGGGGVYVPPPAPAPGPAPAPVPPRSRRRRFGMLALIGGLMVALLAVIAIPIIIIVALANSDFDVTTEREVRAIPATVDDIPSLISEDDATIVLDLRELDADDFDGASLPVDVRIDLDFGVVEVIVPDDLRINVDAEALAGDVDVFSSSSDGLFNERRFTEDDPHIDIEIDLKAGEVDVRRG